MSQEWIVFIIVAGAGIWLFLHFFRLYLAAPLSEWLLKRGKVKWAMRIRHGRSSRQSGKKQDCCE